MDKFLSTHELPQRERMDRPLERAKPGPMTGEPRGLPDADYCVRFGTADDFAELRLKIEERRIRLPRLRFWVCTNPKCGFRVRFPGDRDLAGSNCVRCNMQAFKDGGVYREMTKKEVAQFLEDEKATDERGRKRIAQNKADLKVEVEKMKRNPNYFPPGWRY
jgi:hypothetical protein